MSIALTSITIANQTLRNRYIMGSMHTGLEELPNGFEAMAAYYAERAKGEVALIITGGVSPNAQGQLWPGAIMLQDVSLVDKHKIITTAVHNEGGKIALQILHAGRYGVHDQCVSASAIQAPINIYTPRALTIEEIENTISDFAYCAQLAEQAKYDGIEIMGSEGYLINQFISPRTNQRTDAYGGSMENRMRFAIEIVRAIKAAVSENFILIFRISIADLVENGSSKDEIVYLAQALEKEGVHIFNTGIGWHEARIPTISMRVPRGAYAWAAAWLKEHVSIPVSATNRINTPELANEIISSGKADLVSLARPLLADPFFVQKARTGNAHRINTCIACNQACLDQIFSGETASCLVNPFAARELTWKIIPTKNTKRIAVIGAGVSGCAVAITLSQRGFQVEVFEKSNAIGGQFKWAAQIPGKEEMNETLRYYSEELKELQVPIHLNCKDSSWLEDTFDFHVITTGVVPKELNSLKSDHSIPVLNYVEAIEQESLLGKEIVIIGSGGIAMDVASLLGAEAEGITDYQDHWGVDASLNFPGALKEKVLRVAKRKIHFVQRTGKKLGFKLGKTTVWSHRTELAELGTQIHSYVSNMEIRDGAFLMTKGEHIEVLNPSAIINCTGQESNLPGSFNVSNHVVLGGAKSSERLDAKRAIYEATAWAIQFEM